MQSVLDNMGIGYALTYLVGLVGLMLVVRYLPSLARLDLNTEAQKIARERGLSDSESRKTYLPIIRAYRVGPELAAWIGGRTLRETGIYPHTGCYVERIRRNGILASPMVTPSFRKGTRSPWWATPRATRSSTSTTATARRCSIATSLTCRSSPKRSW